MSSSEAANIPIFAALKSKDRDKVLGNTTQRTYAAGATLVAEGEKSVNLFFIVSGHAKVQTASAGERTVLGPGDFFGDLGLIEQHARSASVVAEDELTVVMLPAWEFRSLLDEHPEMAVPMVYALIERTNRILPRGH